MTKTKKTFNGACAMVVADKKPRKVRVKSEADVWFEQMKADFVKNGAEHLATAKTKMEK